MEKVKRNVVVFVLLLVVGMAYGYLSAVRNENPYYPVPGEFNVPEERMVKAWHWQPSPVWLPSYILCNVPRNGFGIEETRSGFLFRSEAKRSLYFRASTILGGGMGVVVAGIAMVVLRKSKRGAGPLGHPDRGDS
jgi:hypothetical protein